VWDWVLTLHTLDCRRVLQQDVSQIGVLSSWIMKRAAVAVGVGGGAADKMTSH
jgi:hypothetical protein